MLILVLAAVAGVGIFLLAQSREEGLGAALGTTGALLVAATVFALAVFVGAILI